MAHSRHIKAALKAIHADNPKASYEDMRGHLRDIYRDQYGELGESLTDALASEPLSIDQHRYINEALKVLKACMKRIEAYRSVSKRETVSHWTVSH